MCPVCNVFIQYQYVRIRLIMSELLSFNSFQDGSRPPSWILADVNFDGKSGYGTES